LISVALTVEVMIPAAEFLLGPPHAGELSLGIFEGFLVPRARRGQGLQVGNLPLETIGVTGGEARGALSLDSGFACFAREWAC
jgi:hypothetical protein